jgi:hypothetical protein
LLWDLL